MELYQVVFAVDDIQARVPVFESVFGVAAEVQDDSARLLGPDGTLLTLMLGSESGICEVGFKTDALEQCKARLEDAGIVYTLDADDLCLAPQQASGVRVRIVDASTAPEGLGGSGDAYLDHVALGVRDLERSTAHWSVVLGVPSEMMGVHPVSGGAFTASRLALGSRMIELISPVPGQPSNIANRLASRGEGPIVVAIPAVDIDATLAKLQALDVRCIWQDPHWMVHPKDSGGTLIQLTPRVQH